MAQTMAFIYTFHHVHMKYYSRLHTGLFHQINIKYTLIFRVVVPMQCDDMYHLFRLTWLVLLSQSRYLLLSSYLFLTSPTGERPFSCSMCTKTFNQKGALQIHMAKHTGEKPHMCDFCPMTFAQKGNLRAHIQVYAGL